MENSIFQQRSVPISYMYMTNSILITHVRANNIQISHDEMDELETEIRCLQSVTLDAPQSGLDDNVLGEVCEEILPTEKQDYIYTHVL